MGRRARGLGKHGYPAGEMLPLPQVMGAEHGDLCTLLGLQVASQSHFHVGTL